MKSSYAPIEVSAPETAAPRAAPRIVAAGARILLGLPLVVFGLNGFLNFIPPPQTPLPEGAMAFVAALANTSYMMQLIGATHLVVGVLLLLNR